eukprot:396946-Rhodomonas_salina.2
MSAGLLVEHGLHIFGKGHTHQPNGTSQHRPLPAPIPDAPEAAVQPCSTEQASRSLVVTGQPSV